MLTLHHLERSRSHRVLWLLEELGLEYRIESYQRDAKTMLAPASLQAVHPLGKSPVLEDGELVIAESGAILEYLLDTYGQGRLKPAGGQALVDYRYWMHYAEGSLMPLLVMKLVFSRIPKGPMPFLVRPVARKLMAKVTQSFLQPQLSRHLAFIEQHLSRGDWFAGEFSAADIQMSFVLEAAASRAGLDDCPNIMAFIERCRKNSQYQEAIRKGGPVILQAD
ncbi:glutathione S-transferase [Gallaecimonas pentaromativorans]|uniref:glutathione transferase n=1 Tax=Gallaecimonas pentaromativorans TaxID=584787 RepID=A0A3N1P4I0_9GAMM|nr:glutathione S-transferase [Gallaecimonas pentaromativorans]MED5526898.1 glutathione S-transferase [Pseudomonadota bacterium]ROQ23363.1 glutathione S-transferase [Gallaecimonas pentaromativorans]